MFAPIADFHQSVYKWTDHGGGLEYAARVLDLIDLLMPGRPIVDDTKTTAREPVVPVRDTL